ncbi:hypothetical protein P7C73_g1114, partial [Tremellales sp. Uapishka_1]
MIKTSSPSARSRASSSASTSTQDGESEAPVSISTLRSRFENLAKANGNGSEKPKAAGEKRAQGVGNDVTTTAETENNGQPAVSRLERATKMRMLTSMRHKVTILPSLSRTDSPLPLPTVSSPNPSARPIPPAKPSTLLKSTLSPSLLAHPSPSPPPLPNPYKSTHLSPAFPSIPSATVSPIIRRPPPTPPPKSASAYTSPTVSDDGLDDDPTISVQSLRARFSAPPSTNNSPPGTAKDLNRSGLLKAPSIDDTASLSPGSHIMGRQASAPAMKRVTTMVATTVAAGTPVQGLGFGGLPSSSEPFPGKDPLTKMRSASPAPPPPNRATKPPRHTPVPTPSTSGGPSSPETLDVSLPDVAVLPPPIPARRPTAPIPEAPPIPGNKPSLPLSDAPPRLPARSRANTIPRSDTAPPRLPARTIDESSSSRGVSPSPASYIPPPPPSRTALAATAAANAASPPRRQASNEVPTRQASQDMSSEDEEDDATPAPGLTSMAKRMLEDYPDSAHANRRPPDFVPPVKITVPHQIAAMAVFGRHVCVGTHHVRVYDTQLSDRPIFVVDLKDTGLDFRVKEPKVTAMCFRPASTAADQGRYVWCGTKDGHLWELDIKSGLVTDTRPSAHGSAVTNIFRHKHWLLTLEDGGKLNAYEVKDTSVVLSRTSRISDKQTFARMINGKLWTSSGPPTRSTTNASSKGPTIRVYDPLSSTVMPPGKTLFTNEWTGAVTSACIRPLFPDKVYLGHEGGFVSIWSNEDLTCLQVLKISATDILSLEGVGRRLWMGDRRGKISVYDVEEKPWHCTNVWLAHRDLPIHALVVDPWSIEQTGRFALWSFARDTVRAWDGLLSVDWTENEMINRESEYCISRQANLLVCSWNIDSAKPTDLGGSVENALFLEQVLGSVDSPDIIVFGFQEVIPLTDKKLTAKTLLFGGKNKDGILASDRISVAYRQWLDKLQWAVKMAMPANCPYVKVHSESLVGLFTCVFVKAAQKETLRDIDITTIKRGVGGIYGNKGAIVARMVIDDTSICFINVHLAAGQSAKAARNADLVGIFEEKAIFPAADELSFVRGGDGTEILDHELVILNGDLNYRIDQRRENVIASINAGDLNYLLEHDQLRKEMKGNHAFRLRSFEEAPITFAPTYKYTPNSTEYDSSEKRRIPAWCDRILFTKSPRIHAINYMRYETTVSDHRPISAGFRVMVKAVDRSKMSDVRSEVVAELAKRESEKLEKMVEAFEQLL